MLISNKARISGKLSSRKHKQITKSELRPLIMVKQDFRDLFGSKMSGLGKFYIALI